MAEIKLTLKSLMAKERALNKILGVDVDRKLAYRMRKIAGKTRKELEDAETERLKIVEAHQGKLNPMLRKYEFPTPEAEASFQEEWKEFLTMEISLDIALIPYDCLEGVRLSAYDMAEIDEFVEEPVVQ